MREWRRCRLESKPFVARSSASGNLAVAFELFVLMIEGAVEVIINYI